MNTTCHSSQPNAIALPSLKPLLCLSAGILVVFLLAGCGKKESAAAPAPPPEVQQNTAPAPAPTPAQAVVVPPAENGDINATLAQLTRELHRTMIGRKLNRNFEEFVALRNLQVPPPPPGKKYAIDERWKVILVNN